MDSMWTQNGLNVESMWTQSGINLTPSGIKRTPFIVQFRVFKACFMFILLAFNVKLLNYRMVSVQ